MQESSCGVVADPMFLPDPYISPRSSNRGKLVTQRSMQIEITENSGTNAYV
eukprot:m.14972 g.14972  ORF g.14972 m.14972 type:complete len:51 (-) comp10365_c0_seq1:39-191(-)